jgi:hypothetical protein
MKKTALILTLMLTVAFAGSSFAAEGAAEKHRSGAHAEAKVHVKEAEKAPIRLMN